MATRFVRVPCDVTGLLQKFKCPGGGGGVPRGLPGGVDVEVTNCIPANSHTLCLWTKNIDLMHQQFQTPDSQICTNCFFTHD